jgi:hypothetical protein
MCLHPLDQEKIALSRFSVSCVCFGQERVINSNIGNTVTFQEFKIGLMLNNSK